MNINPKTGKIWINNYLQMYGTLFSNQKHPYIQLQRYYEIIGRLEGKAKSANAMILHSHIAQITCNRGPGIHANIFMHIDSEKGTISNSTEMKEWMLKDGWMNCSGGHLLEIASNEVWWVVYKAMMDVGLITGKAGVLRAMVPINGRFLPIPYAYVAFLSRLKKDSDLKTQIQKALSDVPSKIKTNLENLPKEDLINELIKLKTQGISSSKKSELFKLLFDEITTKFPHTWGDNPVKNRENFLENIAENFPGNNSGKKSEKNPENFSEKNLENNSENIFQEITVENILEKIPEKIAEDISKQKGEQVKELPIDEIHNFKSNKKSRTRLPSPPKEIVPTIEETLFFADDVTGKDAEKIVKKIPENKVEENFQDFSDFDFDNEDEDIIPLDTDTDIFGLPIEEDLSLDSIPEIPEAVESITEKEIDDFWSA